MYPILSIGPISLPLPPLILVIGFWFGSSLVERKAKQLSFDTKILDKFIWCSLFFGIIGARLSFIARNPLAFKGNLISIISINPNLFDLSGGILVAIAAGYIIISKNKVPGWKVIDQLTPFFLVLLISIGLSNFASGDGFGTRTSLPWGITLWGIKRHPVQLYYVIANILILAIIQSNMKDKLHKPGISFTHFLIMVNISYLFLSAFQEPKTIIVYGLHLNKIVSWLLLLLSLVIYWFRLEPLSKQEAKNA